MQTEVPKLTPITGGFEVKRTDEYIVVVMLMLFNWRLIVMIPDQTLVYEHGYCYFGTDDEALTRAILAGQAWDDPLNTDPIGYDKKAF